MTDWVTNWWDTYTDRDRHRQTPGTSRWCSSWSTKETCAVCCGKRLRWDSLRAQCEDSVSLVLWSSCTSTEESLQTYDPTTATELDIGPFWPSSTHQITHPIRPTQHNPTQPTVLSILIDHDQNKEQTLIKTRLSSQLCEQPCSIFMAASISSIHFY